MSHVALVTGASRGIGLDLCRLLIERGDIVVACRRGAGTKQGAEPAEAPKPE